jgi:Flp pilus assembly protein TadG
MRRPVAVACSPRAASSRRRGAAVVEFAIVAPVLIMLLLGMIEFGRVMMAMELLNNAARNGARAAVLSGSTTSSVQDAVTQTLTGTSVTGASTPVIKVNGSSSTDLSAALAGDQISVTVSVTTSNVSWLPNALFLGNKTLTTTVVMRHE